LEHLPYSPDLAPSDFHLFPALKDYTGEQKKIFFLVPWFLGLFLGLFGALVQKNALDRPHQL